VGVTRFQIVSFIVECLVIAIGLFEIEMKFHPIRRLLNWRASRSRISAQKRINKLTDRLTTLQSKMDVARRYSASDLVSFGFGGVFLVLVCITLALLTQSPFLQAVAELQIVPPNVLSQIHNPIVQNVVKVIAYPLSHDRAARFLQIYTNLFLILAWRLALVFSSIFLM
jgi:hypothetical protein